MITFKRFGFHGNLGNQLFQYASILGMSETYGHKVLMPTWKYSKYFQDPPEEWCNCFDCKHIKEPHFHYAASIPQLRDKNFAYDMEGWWQSEKYWEQSKLLVAQKLTFENNFIESVLKKSGEITTGNKTIAISIRRGDYVDNPNYYQLPIEYYITALMENFEDWRSHEILIFSDDLDYCRVHFSCMTNVHFADELGCKKDIEQLALMSLCDHFIISNSTFSWWGAYLGEKNIQNYSSCLPLRRQAAANIQCKRLLPGTLDQL
jgi:hypothetical protein